MGSPEVQTLRGAVQSFEHPIFHSQPGYTAQVFHFAEGPGIVFSLPDLANNARAKWLDAPEFPEVEILQTATQLSSTAAEAEDLQIFSGEISTSSTFHLGLSVRGQLI